MRKCFEKWVTFLLLALPLTCILRSNARAQDSPPPDLPDENRSKPKATPQPAELASEDEMEEIVVTANPEQAPALPKEGARSEVTRDDLQRRLPRSAPDALRFEPGVFVQQTAHSQGSAFIRGLTGQQTLLMFDGIRLNNSTYRQGPNQYFFTLDSQSIDSIQIIRGGCSTRYGSDALGGVILALPMEPSFKTESNSPVHLDPHLRLRGGTADGELGGRLQADFAWGQELGFFGGIGGRQVGELESGGVVTSPANGSAPLVPRFENDGRTQKGTGFDELTFDSRLAYRIAPSQVLKLAVYGYRQYDAPRTDQCPAAYAPSDECLQYDEQFRTLVYAVYQARGLWKFAHQLRGTISWQQQHERRTLNRPSSFVKNIGRDVVDTLGLTLNARTEPIPLAWWLSLDLEYGLDTYHDVVRSAAWISFLDISITQKRSRGQYLDGSGYTYGGAFAETSLHLLDQWTLHGGGRLSWIVAHAPSDPESGSLPVNRSWVPVVGNAGLDWRALKNLWVLLNFDHSFRAPNLDDMTSRQQTGPGFQFENARLNPETADTLELGARLSWPLFAEFWVFHTNLHGAMIKSPKQDSDCPPGTPGCQASWTKLQLVNAPRDSEIWGMEASVLAELPAHFEIRSTLAWTWGQGPNVSQPPANPDIPYQSEIPLSRIPPLNGTVEVVWRHPAGITLSSDVRWATQQDRLALADFSDERIPKGGTPGFAVFDLRAAYRVDDVFIASITMENIFDRAYRYHGSSVNGPGRSLMFFLDLGPLWRWPGSRE